MNKSTDEALAYLSKHIKYYNFISLFDTILTLSLLFPPNITNLKGFIAFYCTIFDTSPNFFILYDIIFCNL